MMADIASPPDDGLLVAPVRERQYQAFAGQARVADVIDEAVNLLEPLLQRIRIFEISAPLAGPRTCFEDHREHGTEFPCCCENARVTRALILRAIRVELGARTAQVTTAPFIFS